MTTRKRGFTLIELLVVIAIIAILAAILFPIFAAARASARTAECLSNLCQMGRGVRGYTADWGGYLPESWVGGVSWYVPNPPQLPWERKIATGYIEPNPDVFTCPETRQYYAPGELMSSYSMNGHLTEVNISMAANPAKLIVIFETNCKSRTPNSPNVSWWDQSNEWHQLADGQWWGNGDDLWWVLRFPGPHRGGIENILFSDAHVKGFRRWESESMTFFAGR